MQPVVVAYDAVTGRYGIAFHRETCKVTERIFGSKVVDRDWAERRGISACYYCFLECPACHAAVRELRNAQLAKAREVRSALAAKERKYRKGGRR